MSDALKPDPAVLAQMQGAPKGFYLLGFQDAVKAATAQPQQAAPGDWPAYVAGMIGAYLGWAVDDDRINAVAAIITRRMWAAQPQQAAEAHAASIALDNCRCFARRHRKEEWAQTILRFCAEGGSTESPLRVSTQPQQAPMKERPEFVAGYAAGLADGRRIAEREQAAQPVAWVPRSKTTGAYLWEDAAEDSGSPINTAIWELVPVFATAQPQQATGEQP